MADEIKFNEEAFEKYKHKLEELKQKTQSEPETYANEDASTTETETVANEETEDVEKINSFTNATFSSDGGDRILVKDLGEVMHDSMLPYTQHVIMERALPRVEDGLKPVQRRIMFTMLQLGLDADKPFRKSARIVGDCLGKYHPHGDTSVYDAMVRMAQPFNMRGLLVDGHGNFGSIDGDSAAAMRYTEARLAPLASELLRDLDEDTVDFTLNFDDSLKEPETLPGRYPNLLVNGASGIAVSLATNIPPHNLAEVIDGTIAYINNPKIDLKEMMKIIKGPDFPTGAYAICGEELFKAYQTGRGKITMRAKLSIEQNGDKKSIVITELPFQTNKANLLQSIASTLEDKKETCLGGIQEIVDESDRMGMRAVIKLKKDANANKIVKDLFKYTGLQSTFGINMVAIADNRPRQMGLLEIIKYYVEYQRKVIYRRSKFRYEQATERAHIVNGLIVAINNIDEVVKIIKKSKNVGDARINLRERFGLSEKQAQAILDMRLARLTSLELEKLEQELEELNKQIKELSAIIASKRLQFDVISKEMLEIKKQFKDSRRTIILKNEDDYNMPIEDEIKNVDAIIEECKVCVNANGLIKRVPIKNFNASTRAYNNQTSLNDFNEIILSTNTKAQILIFTNLGNCIKRDVGSLIEAKWRDRGVMLINLTKGEKIVSIFELNSEKQTFAFFTLEGMVKFSDSTEYNIQKPVFSAIKLKEKDEVINVQIVAEADNMVFATKKGMILIAEKTDVPLQGRVSIGVKGVNLNDGDSCAFAGLCGGASELVAVSTDGFAKRLNLAEIEPIARYRKGVQLNVGEKNAEIMFASLNTNEDLILKTNQDNFTRLNASNLAFENRLAKGKPAIKFAKDEKLTNVFKFLK